MTGQEYQAARRAMAVRHMAERHALTDEYNSSDKTAAKAARAAHARHGRSVAAWRRALALWASGGITEASAEGESEAAMRALPEAAELEGWRLIGNRIIKL